jgi:formamidopyrimidine-DNA glycosylase
MPEIPDLEVLKERFQVLIGDSVVSVRILFPLTFRVIVKGTPDELLSGQRVYQVTRRGKFLIFCLDNLYLAFNMMLTGRLLLTTEEKQPRNTVVVLEFASGKALRFGDFKKMGKIYITDELNKIPQYPELGVEPLSEDFTSELLSTLLRDSRAIKLVLTDQRVIAGIGNAYSDEILFHARLNPRKTAESLTTEEISILYDSILYILKNAICEIRSKLKDTSEEIRDFFLVHGKKGDCCPVCGSTIREIEVARRMTHICPQCQQVKVPW